MKPNFVRLETGGAAVGRSVATVRNAIRAGQVAGVRDGKLVLVDLAALKKRFVVKPVTPGRPSASNG